MRYRSMTLFSRHLTGQVVDYINGNPLIVNTSYDELATKSIEDCLTPEYFHVVRSGGVKPYLPVEIKTISRVAIPMHQSFHKITPSKDASGDWFMSPIDIRLIPEAGLPAWDSGMIASVTNSAIASSRRETLDGLTFLAELHKTKDLIKSSMGRVFNFADRALAQARRVSRRPSSVPRLFSKYWLEYRYGWRPLLYDIQDLVHQVQEGSRTYNEGRSAVSVDLGSSSTLVTGGTSYDTTCVRTVVGTRTYRGYAFSVGHYGSTPSFNPIQTGWELIPYSFVVDWFFNVGDFLTAVTPNPAVDTPVSGYSVRDHFVCTRDYNFGPSKNPNLINMSTGGSYTLSLDYYTRVQSGAVLPRLFPRLTTAKFADLFGLITQRSAALRLRI